MLYALILPTVSNVICEARLLLVGILRYRVGYFYVYLRCKIPLQDFSCFERILLISLIGSGVAKCQDKYRTRISIDDLILSA